MIVEKTKKQPDGATHRSGEGEQQIAALSSPAHPSPLQALAPFALWPRFAWQGRDASPQAYRSGPPEEESHRQPIIKRRRQAGESREEDVARDEPAELSLALEAVPEAADPAAAPWERRCVRLHPFEARHLANVLE